MHFCHLLLGAFFQEVICVWTGVPPNCGEGWIKPLQLCSGDPRHCPGACPRAAAWAVVLLTAAYALTARQWDGIDRA